MQSLKGTTAFMLQEIESNEFVITLKGQDRSREVTLRRRFWQRHYDVYLHSFDYMELSYRKVWMWKQVRDSIKQTSSGVLGIPLVSIEYYEPQNDLDVCYTKVKNELEFPDEVSVKTLETPMPRSIAPQLETLESLAKLAFPASSAEKDAAKKYRKTVSATRNATTGKWSPIARVSHSSGGVAKRATARKTPARKPVAKKAPAKKAMARKAPARKSAR